MITSLFARPLASYRRRNGRFSLSQRVGRRCLEDAGDSGQGNRMTSRDVSSSAEGNVFGRSRDSLFLRTHLISHFFVVDRL
ncbi:hypothetical protein QR680_001712 [Steinernema hermaphroditum]|uniref:Uncharacterized protein n=1 Tax=Steinernema hermaphroditum TaxID=289476 RepID=A0AA39H0F4_9BILA|nr:hypothetical protein QR680_001712 [Steinernema hermaphroditum]